MKPTPEKAMKQVAVRMSQRLHRGALKAAKGSGVSFGEYVRRAVGEKIDRGRGDGLVFSPIADIDPTERKCLASR